MTAAKQLYHLSADKYEAIQSRYAKAKEQDYMKGNLFGGLLTEFISAPLMVAEGIQNQFRAWRGEKTDYYFVEARNETREQVTAGMGTVGKTVYYCAAETVSVISLALFTGCNPNVMAAAMGLTTSDEVQMSKEQAGVDPKKAAGTAALCGALDAALGSLVFGKIDIDRNIIKGVQKSIGEQLGSAFVHGSASVIISNRCYQTIDLMINGTLSDIGICYTAYLDEGLSEEEAWSKTENDLAEREFWNAMTGGLLAAGYTTIQLLSHGVKMKKPPKRDDYDDFLEVQNAAGSAGDERGSKIVEINNPVLDNIRTGSALKGDSLHTFNDIIDNYAGDATKFSLTGGDGVERTLYQLEGSLNGKQGIFEWIVDPDSAKGVTHRRFIEGVGITGKPNARP